jgi:hypothetical protein
MTEQLIGYIREIEIFDNWGEKIVDIFLKGLTIDEINQLRNDVIKARQDLLLVAAAYFFLILKDFHLPENADIRDKGFININGESLRWEFSFNEARQAIPTREFEYVSAVNAIKSFLPFYYIFVLLKEGKTFETPQDIYIAAEKKIFGGSIIDEARRRIIRTNEAIDTLKSIANKYWFSNRIFDRRDRMIELTTKFNKLFQIESFCYQRTPEAEEEFAKTERLEDILVRWDQAQRNYAGMIELENQVYEGRWTIPHVPAELSLVGEQKLPERPPRPTPEEIWLESEKAYPVLENRAFSVQESWCLGWVDTCNLWQDKFDEFKTEFDTGGCAEKKGEYFRCKFLSDFFDAYWENREILLNTKYPEDVEKKIVPMPVFVEPSPRDKDRMNIIFALDGCTGPLGGVPFECLLRYYDGIEMYNSKYTPNNPSMKDSHRLTLVSYSLALNRGQEMDITRTTFNELINDYQTIYQVSFDNSQLLPLETDLTLLQHADPILLAKESEFDTILKTRILREKTIAESAAIERIAIDDSTFENVWRERDEFDFYRLSPQGANFERWKETEAIAKQAVARFNPLVRAFVNKWGIQPDYGSKQVWKGYVERDWGKVPPYDYLGV